MRRINFLISMLIVTMFIACKTTSQKPEVKENFSEFYDKFYSDTTFQLTRTVFPLPGYNSDIDLQMPDDFAEQMGVSKDNEYYWEKEEWVFINTVEDNDDTVVKQIEKTDTLTTEKLVIPNSGFKIVRKFKPMKGNWYLAYYFYQDI